MANLSTLRKTFLTVYITGNQNITGVKNFANKPTVNGVDILLSGEVPPLPETIVYTTGNQTIGGRKRFFYSNPDEYFIIDNSEFNGESGWAFIDNVTASIGYSDQYVEFASGYVRFYGSTPTVNGTPILLSGEAPTLENLQLTGQNLQNQIDNLDLNYASDLELSQTGSNLQSQIDTKANSADIYNAAIDWTTNHTLADGTRYLAGDLVYVSGKIYKANFDNESIPVTSALYWTDLGNGYRLNIDGRDIPNIPISLAVQTGLDSKYDASNPSGFITGIDLSNYATLSSLELTGQNLQNQTDSLSGAAVLVYGDQYVDGQKIFRGEVRIKDLYVTGTETIVNTTNTNVGSNYILLNATGGAIDAGIFIVTGNGLTGISDTGAIIGYDVPANRWVFGNTSRDSDLSLLEKIAGITDITNYSGFVNGNFYSINNPSGFINNQDIIFSGIQHDFYKKQNNSTAFNFVNVSFPTQTVTLTGLENKYYLINPDTNGRILLLSTSGLKTGSACIIRNVSTTIGPNVDVTISGINTGNNVFALPSPINISKQNEALQYYIFNGTGFQSEYIGYHTHTLESVNGLIAALDEKPTTKFVSNLQKGQTLYWTASSANWLNSFLNGGDVKTWMLLTGKADFKLENSSSQRGWGDRIHFYIIKPLNNFLIDLSDNIPQLQSQIPQNYRITNLTNSGWLLQYSGSPTLVESLNIDPLQTADFTLTKPAIGGIGPIITNTQYYNLLPNSIVQTTGNQLISGLKDFATCPTVNTIPVALSGEATSSIEQLVKNDSNTTLYKGQPVYVSGSNGNNILIQPASNSGDSTSSKTFGLLKQTLLNNQQGYVVTEGPLSNVDTSMATEGDPVWLGPTGNLIYGLANKPKAPQHLVSLGFVERAHQNQGKIFVKVQNGFELEELHNVRIVNEQNSDIIIYNSGSGLWLNSGVNFGNFETKNSFNIVTPQGGDFILKKSYQTWIHGSAFAVDSLMTKWAALGTSTYQAESLTLEFLGGTINNKIIPKTNQFIGQTTGVSSANLIYRDDGYGLQVANYVDFINEIFSDYGLSSRIYAGTGVYEGFVLDYATTEQFNFLFQETTNGWGGLSTSMYYRLYTEAPYNIVDDYGSILTAAKYWTDL